MVDVNWLHIGGAAGNIPALQHAMWRWILVTGQA
jgi:hypothetical protein